MCIYIYNIIILHNNIHYPHNTLYKPSKTLNLTYIILLDNNYNNHFEKKYIIIQVVNMSTSW